MSLAYHRHLSDIVKADLEYIRVKDTQYNASWKRRGGIGAFFTIARPWDRLENIARTAAGLEYAAPYDIFGVIDYEGLEGPDGSLIACVRDLRRYLLLVEAEMQERLRERLHRKDVADTGASREQMTEEELLEGLEKWLDTPKERFPQQECYKPGTPEDGGHHARQAIPTTPPWFLTAEQLEIIPENLKEVWNSAGELEPRILPEDWQALKDWEPQIAALYSPVYAVATSGDESPITYRDDKEVGNNGSSTAAFWLDISQCPREERDYYRRLPLECNLVEAKQLMEYIELYAWDASGTRYCCAGRNGERNR